MLETGRKSRKHGRKRNSTGQSPAARTGFGGVGVGGASVEAGRQAPKGDGAIRRRGEVPTPSWAQANGEGGPPVPGPSTCLVLAQAEGWGSPGSGPWNLSESAGSLFSCFLPPRRPS